MSGARVAPASAAASAQPIGPPPTMTRSRRSRSMMLVAHRRFHLGDALGRLGGQDFATVLGDQRVVLDTHADIAEPLRHAFARPDVTARLDGEHHTRRELAPGPGMLVV